MSDHFRPLGDPSGYDLIDAIQQELEGHGWEPLLGPGSRWVEHVFDNGRGVLRVDYAPDNRDLDVSFQTGRLGAEMYTRLPDDHGRILDVLFRHQATLSATRWREFVEDLVAVAPTVFAVTPDEDEDDVEVVSPDQAELREGEWVMINRG